VTLGVVGLTPGCLGEVVGDSKSGWTYSRLSVGGL